MHRHPVSKEQLLFKRRDYRADPIEGPTESQGDFWVAIATVGGILGIIVVLVLERL